MERTWVLDADAEPLNQPTQKSWTSVMKNYKITYCLSPFDPGFLSLQQTYREGIMFIFMSESVSPDRINGAPTVSSQVKAGSPSPN